MSRTIIITAIPASTRERLIFPLAPNNQFDTSSYNPGFTDGRASLEEINQILTEIQAARQPLVDDLHKVYCTYILTIILGILATAVLGFILAMTLGVFLIFVRFVLYMILLFWSMMTFRTKIIKLNEQTKAVAQKVIDNYSGSFGSRGLRWAMPMHFPMWIELHKDYLISENPGQPIYMPPNQYQPAPIYPGQGQGQPQYQDNYYQNQQNSGPYHA